MALRCGSSQPARRMRLGSASRRNRSPLPTLCRPLPNPSAPCIDAMRVNTPRPLCGSSYDAIHFRKLGERFERAACNVLNIQHISGVQRMDRRVSARIIACQTQPTARRKGLTSSRCAPQKRCRDHVTSPHVIGRPDQPLVVFGGLAAGPAGVRTDGFHVGQAPGWGWQRQRAERRGVRPAGAVAGVFLLGRRKSLRASARVDYPGGQRDRHRLLAAGSAARRAACIAARGDAYLRAGAPRYLPHAGGFDGGHGRLQQQIWTQATTAAQETGNTATLSLAAIPCAPAAPLRCAGRTRMRGQIGDSSPSNPRATHRQLRDNYGTLANEKARFSVGPRS